MPLLNRIVNIAYNNPQRNRSAMACRGWNPPNRYLLDSPEIKMINDRENDKYLDYLACLDPVTLNTSTGKASDVMDTLIQHRMINGGIENRHKKLREGMDVKAALRSATKMTSGVLATNGIYSLDHPEFLVYHKTKLRMERKEALDKRRKAHDELVDRKNAIHAIRMKRGDGETSGFKNWSVKEMQSYLQYKKRDKDPAMPKKNPAVRLRVLSIMGRSSPIPSPISSNDESDTSPTTNNERTTALAAAFPPPLVPPIVQDLNPLFLLAAAAPAHQNNNRWVDNNEEDVVARI